MFSLGGGKGEQPVETKGGDAESTGLRSMVAQHSPAHKPYAS